jgi:hypothetical protein
LLKPTDLKLWLHKRELTPLDKLLLVLGTFDAPCQIGDIKARAREGGFAVPRTWNPSAVLGRSNGLAIRSPNGWELTDQGCDRLRSLGLTHLSPAAASVAHDLRAELVNITNADTRAFVEEAITCFEYQLYRAAIVSSWIAAVQVLQQHVHANHLAAFNAEALRVDAKWKLAKTTDDLGRMKESEFLDRLVALSVIGKNVKAELADCLDRRNGCGHPNSMKLGPNTVAHHLEILLLNIFKVFRAS